MSYVRNGPFLIKLSFDPLLKPRLCGIRQELACRTCHDWYKPKVYFLVPNRLSKIDDLLELVREQHGIRSEISFIAAEFGVIRSLPIETLREIKEPIEVVPRGPGAPKVDFPKCNCAAAADSNHVANMIRNIYESVDGKDDKKNMPGVRERDTIQHPGNLMTPEGKMSKADVEHRNSNASSRPEDKTLAGEFTELSVSQEEDESVGANVASGSEMVTSVQESISSKGYHDNAEAGEYFECEDMGSVMDVSCKETEDGNEHYYPVGVNETASNHEDCAGYEPLGYSDLESWTTLSSNVGGENEKNKLSGVRQSYTIQQHPGNTVPPEGKMSKADAEHRNSNASSPPEDVTPAGKFPESSGSQEKDESVAANVASDSKMATTVQESINIKGYHDNAEAGESIGCEDVGYVMDVSCKETEDDNEQCYSVGVNETASNHEECAGNEPSGYSDLESWTTLSSNVDGENEQNKLSGVRQSYTIQQHPGNTVPPEGETSKADVEHRNSNASSRPEDATPASEYMESNRGQEEDKSIGSNAASGSEMATSVQESINSKGYHDNAEVGESIGCEDMGSLMDVSSKETEDGNEQYYPVGVNKTASNHDECAGDEQSGYSELGKAALFSNVEEIMDSQECDDDTEMDVNDVDGKEDSSLEISDEGTRKNDSTNTFEGASEREGFDVTTEETGTPDKKSKSDSITSGCDSLSECLNPPKTLAEQLIESEKNITFDEHSYFFTSTPRFPMDTIRTSNGRPDQPQKFFDSTIASEDQGDEAAVGQNYFQEEDEESGEKLFPQS